jgi:hypothetical protein
MAEMRRRATILPLLAAALALPCAAPAGTVDVVFAASAVHAGGHDYAAQQWVPLAIRDYLEGLGAQQLAPDRLLKIEIVAIDLAGIDEWWRRDTYNVPVLRDVSPPRIALRYRLTQHDRTLAEGEDVLIDVNYLANPAARFVPEPLRYEKTLLAAWFRRIAGD